MILVALLLAATPTPGADPRSAAQSPGCEQRARDLAGMVTGVLAKMAGLSPEGTRIFTDLNANEHQRTSCEVKPESDLARERLLIALSAEKPDPQEIARAREHELTVIARDEAATLDRLLAVMNTLSLEDRTRLAGFLLRDLREGWVKRQRHSVRDAQ